MIKTNLTSSLSYSISHGALLGDSLSFAAFPDIHYRSDISKNCKCHRFQNLNCSKVLCVIFYQQGNMLMLYQSQVSS